MFVISKTDIFNFGFFTTETCHLCIEGHLKLRLQSLSAILDISKWTTYPKSQNQSFLRIKHNHCGWNGLRTPAPGTVLPNVKKMHNVIK